MKIMRNKKWISAVISGLFVLSSLSGCGSGDSGKNSDNGTSTDAGAVVSADEVLTDTIEINTSGDYEFDAEEIMYLSGVKVSAYTPGVKYTLRDMDEDAISELFVSVNDTVGVYKYDADSNKAKRTSDYDGDAEKVVSDETAVWVDGGSQWIDGTIYGAAIQSGDPGVKTDYYA